MIMIIIVGGGRGSEPRKMGPAGWGAQNFALFFFSLSRHNVLSFFLSWVSFRGILVVFEAPGPEMFTFGFSGCRVKPRRDQEVGEEIQRGGGPRTGQLQSSIVLVQARAPCICTFSQLSRRLESLQMDAQPFRLLLCRRLCLPLPFSMHPADVAANLMCLATIVRGRGCAAAKVCRELGVRCPQTFTSETWTSPTSTLSTAPTRCRG